MASAAENVGGRHASQTASNHYNVVLVRRPFKKIAWHEKQKV
jgi:hypothetical protein